MPGGAGVGVSDGGHGGARHRGGPGLIHHHAAGGRAPTRRGENMCAQEEFWSQTIKLLPELSTSGCSLFIFEICVLIHSCS